MRHFIGVLIVSVLTMALFPNDALAGTPGVAPVDAQAATVKIDGVRARALPPALDAFREKLPEARAEDYEVLVAAPSDGAYQVDFLPRLAPGEKPTLGGRTSLGRALTVWVSTETYEVQRVAFAR